MTIYDTGTVSVEAGSREVEGLDTTWVLSEVVGGILFFGNASGLIASVEANDRLTLALPWPGRTGRGAYSIAMSTAQAASAVPAFERLNEILNSFRGLSMLGRQVVSAATADAMRRLLGVGTGNLKIDAAGTLAQRGAHDAKPAGFTYLATDQSAVYVRMGDAGWAGPFALAAGEDGREVEISQAGGYIVWRYVGETSWRNVVSLDALRGTDGVDGEEVDLRKFDGFIQWRLGIREWQDLVSLEDIRGDQAVSTLEAIEAAERAEASSVQAKEEADRGEEALAGVTALVGPIEENADRAEAGAGRSEAGATRAETAAGIGEGHAVAAGQSEAAAEDSANASDAARAVSVDAAAGSVAARDKSRAWAEQPVGQPVEGPDTRSALHHATMAGQSNASAAGFASSAEGNAIAALQARQGAETALGGTTAEANRAHDEADRSEAAAIRSENADIGSHTGRTDNPHQVTLAQASNNTMSVANGKAMVGAEEVSGKGYVDSAVAGVLATIRNSVPAAYNTLKGLYDILIDHTSRTNNPHGVTKAQVGLGNVANKSEAQMVANGAIADALGTRARLTGAQFTGVVEVQGAGNGLRHHIPGVVEGEWRLLDDGRLIWFFGGTIPAITIFPTGNLYFHESETDVLDSLKKRLRFDAAQSLAAGQALQALRNLAFNDYWSGLRGATSAANLRSAIDVDRTRQAIYATGGDEQNGLADAPTVRLSADFVARSATALVEGVCSVRSMTSELRFAYLSIRVVDLTAGVIRGGTPEQIVSLEANAVGRYYSLSRSLALQNLTIGNVHRVELLPRGSINNAGAPQGMIISGVN